MTENLKLFIKKVADDPELLGRLKGIDDKDALVAACVEAARAMGLALSAEDFAPAGDAMSEDELAAVAGGATDYRCSCVLGGGGTEDSWDDTCACVLFGYSDSTMCIVIGVE